MLLFMSNSMNVRVMVLLKIVMWIIVMLVVLAVSSHVLLIRMSLHGFLLVIHILVNFVVESLNVFLLKVDTILNLFIFFLIFYFSTQFLLFLRCQTLSNTDEKLSNLIKQSAIQFFLFIKSLTEIQILIIWFSNLSCIHLLISISSYDSDLLIEIFSVFRISHKSLMLSLTNNLVGFLLLLTLSLLKLIIWVKLGGWIRKLSIILGTGMILILMMRIGCIKNMRSFIILSYCLLFLSYILFCSNTIVLLILLAEQHFICCRIFINALFYLEMTLAYWALPLAQTK